MASGGLQRRQQAWADLADTSDEEDAARGGQAAAEIGPHPMGSSGDGRATGAGAMPEPEAPEPEDTPEPVVEKEGREKSGPVTLNDVTAVKAADGAGSCMSK